MKTKEFFGKLLSGYLWGNLLAMAIVVGLLCLGVKYGLEFYTRHGEGIKVPDVTKMKYNNARQLIESDGLQIMVSDSGYNKRMPADCILAQTPGPGTYVKTGHVVYVTVNSASSPSFPLPDLADNSSYREAEAKLTAMGFRLLPPKRINGEMDWVYGIMCRGRRVASGDVVSVEQPLTLIIGDGTYDETAGDIDYIEPEYRMNPDDVDEFEEVPESPYGSGTKESGMSDY